MLGALVASLMAIVAGVEDLALLLDSELRVAEEECPIGFMLLPTAGTEPACSSRWVSSPAVS